MTAQELPMFDPRTMRISTSPGNPTMLYAECLRRGCGWVMGYTTGRLDIIIDTCNEHPCRGGLARCAMCDHLMTEHQPDGCRRAVGDLVCPCVVRG